MATLNMSTDGVSINKSYKSVIDAPLPSGRAAESPTYAIWAVFSVSTPLVIAFGGGAGNKDSVLKVQSTGEGELADLLDELSDGRIQFAFVKVRDPNSGLPKNALIAWCGEGVPERNKGYFTTHAAAVENALPGYHVVITARSESDLTPEGIINKIADSSGAKYSAASQPAPPPVASSKPPPPAAKPAYTPSKSAGGFKPLAGTSSRGVTPTSPGSGFSRAPAHAETDEDGWGADAPPVTRTQLEKVKPAYTPTKVNMAELSSQPTGTTSNFDEQGSNQPGPDVVRGGYQPIGKVDIAAIRRQARESGNGEGDRPEPVRGAYQPVGKVDIGAIRARAQQRDASPEPARPAAATPAAAPRAASSGDSDDEESSTPKSLAERAAAFKQAERISSMPKPKITPKFSQASSFVGTKAPLPTSFDTASQPTITGASRTFADRGGKTPAQLWAEKKARERGEPVPVTVHAPEASPIAPQASGGASEGWKSGYAGKSWAPVQTNATGGSTASAGGPTATASASRDQNDDEEEEEDESAGGARGVSSIRDRFAAAPPPLAAGGAPQLPMHNKPNAGMPAPPSREPEEEEEEERSAPPPLPTATRPVPQPSAAPAMPARSPMPEPEPEEEDEEPIQPSSPVRLAMPVSRSAAPQHDEEEEEEQQHAAAPAQQTLPIRSVPPAPANEPAPAGGAGGAASGITARAEYDYEKAEDNEIDLIENESITNVQKVDEDWWLGTNGKGETGLFPSNYVVEIEGEHAGGHDAAPAAAPTPAAAEAAAHPAGGHSAKPTATSMYDYEAAEENELGFPEGAKITNIEFPDEDWWFGEYNGKSGLFPANYVEIDQ
ncbi:Dynamin- GTPase protein [Ascosphaera pollenicola]|nr:Dynamin- GTPase protein [Ascosphaera pollenicola]